MTEEQQNERQNLSAVQRGLLEEIEGLALCFSAKAGPIPQSAWKFWFDAVKGSTPREAKEAISDWSKTSTRMMTPADLYKALQAKRTNRREADFAKEQQELKKPVPAQVAQAWQDGMREALKRDIPSDAWTKRNRILEAYGFALTETVAKAWRRELNLPSDYRFGDTNGVFPLDVYPDERCSLYFDCRINFMREYESRHGLTLVYDKELAQKKFPSQPLYWTSSANSVGH